MRIYIAPRPEHFVQCAPTIIRNESTYMYKHQGKEEKGGRCEFVNCVNVLY